MRNCMCKKAVAKNIKPPYFYMDCHILDYKTTLWAKFQFQQLYIVVETKVHHIHIKQRWQVSLLQKFRIMQIFVWQTFQSARPQYQRGQAGLHLNSSYVIYAILIPSNINSRQVALTFLCFQASLLSCHNCWPKTGPNHMA